MYCVTIKSKKGKVVIATWTGNASLRLAECVFNKHNVYGSIGQLDDVTKEKGFVGYEKNYLMLTDSVESSRIYMDQGRLNNYREAHGDEWIQENCPELAYLFSEYSLR